MNRGYEYIGILFEFLGILGLLPFVGFIIDTRTGTDRNVGLFFILGVIFGFVGAMYHLVKRVRQILSNMKEDPAKFNYSTKEPGAEERILEVQKGLHAVEKDIDALLKKKRKE